jgi:hypothetical protein
MSAATWLAAGDSEAPASDTPELPLELRTTVRPLNLKVKS